MNLSRFEAVTFDCYGTLVDWEAGMLSVLQPLLERHGHVLERQRVLDLYAEGEAAAEAGPYRRYRDVLAATARHVGEQLGFEVDDVEAGALAASLPDWPVFADTVEALQQLSRRVRLGIISNVDDDLFAGTRRHLCPGDDVFTWITTAQQAGAYKPSTAPFEQALSRLEADGVDRRAVLHAGQSVFHDVVPARALGLATALVERRGRGATLAVDGAEPDLRVPDLASLAAAFEAAG
jgi:2-haloacid dehalogenase